ncbi:DMT family transporter [Marixanthomonas ophiurae]|uniref:DMT family transporter n=1 Tax=Marixanthomonas ophiurae TaxID=387659 RepID=A0A3E1QDD5_9FLAO|nr:DMT family transporter [Marixanthomonas ophiurae]RFN60104.1 DMT family transporter [Marixanthomonas ophiurae]
MTALLFSILSSTLIFVVFKLFDRFKINTLHAIVVNYIVAFSCGLFFYKGDLTLAHVPEQPWFYYTLGLGALFIIIFNLMAITTQKSGLSVVSVATKMSVVIPIAFGLVYYKESLGILKILGIILALVAVYLASIKTKDGIAIQKKNLIYPLLVFLGSGFIDTSIKYLEDTMVAEDEVALFSAIIFSAAACIGILILIGQKIRGTFSFQFKTIIGGIALGFANYFSIYYIIQALRSDILESSGVFTVNNVAIVMVSTLLGITFFKERLLRKNWIGIILAVISIFLVALAKW